MDSKQSSSKADIILAIFLLAGCGFVYWECLSLPESPYEPLGPAFVPETLSLLIGFAALWILFEGLQKWRVQHSGTSNAEFTGMRDFVRHPFLAIAGVLLTFVYIGSMYLGLLGFRSATILFIMALGSLLCKYERKTIRIAHLCVLLFIACTMGLGGYYLFTQVFVVNLP